MAEDVVQVLGLDGQHHQVGAVGGRGVGGVGVYAVGFGQEAAALLQRLADADGAGGGQVGIQDTLEDSFGHGTAADESQFHGIKPRFDWICSAFGCGLDYITWEWGCPHPNPLTIQGWESTPPS